MATIIAFIVTIVFALIIRYIINHATDDWYKQYICDRCGCKFGADIMNNDIKCPKCGRKI